MTERQRDGHGQYVHNLRELMHEAVRRTQQYDAEWNRINDEVNDFLYRSGETDIVQCTKVKAQNIALADALGAGNWWRAKASYLAQVIQAECALRQAGI
jgi:hypothetical protein